MKNRAELYQVNANSRCKVLEKSDEHFESGGYEYKYKEYKKTDIDKLFSQDIFNFIFIFAFILKLLCFSPPFHKQKLHCLSHTVVASYILVECRFDSTLHLSFEVKIFL